MNVFRTLFMTAFIATALIACDEKDEPKNTEPEKESAGTYTGLLSVDQNDGTFFELDNVQVIVEQTATEVVAITMKDVKFSPRMPVSLAEMLIAGVSLSETIQGFSLSGDGIVPVAMGGDFPQYTITNLTGTIIEKELRLSMKCGAFPLRYSGTNQSQD